MSKVSILPGTLQSLVAATGATASDASYHFWGTNNQVTAYITWNIPNVTPMVPPPVLPDITAKQDRLKKRKAPSTVRRDEARLRRWLETKSGDKSSQGPSTADLSNAGSATSIIGQGSPTKEAVFMDNLPIISMDGPAVIPDSSGPYTATISLGSPTECHRPPGSCADIVSHLDSGIQIELPYMPVQDPSSEEDLDTSESQSDDASGSQSECASESQSDDPPDFDTIHHAYPRGSYSEDSDCIRPSRDSLDLCLTPEVVEHDTTCEQQATCSHIHTRERNHSDASTSNSSISFYSEERSHTLIKVDNCNTNLYNPSDTTSPNSPSDISSEVPRLLTVSESPESLQQWIDEISEFIASDSRFKSLMLCHWGRLSRSKPCRDFTDDSPSCEPSMTAAQKSMVLDAMISHISRLCSNVIRTRFHKRVASLQDIWTELHVYFHFPS